MSTRLLVFTVVVLASLPVSIDASLASDALAWAKHKLERIKDQHAHFFKTGIDNRKDTFRRHSTDFGFPNHRVFRTTDRAIILGAALKRLRELKRTPSLQTLQHPSTTGNEVDEDFAEVVSVLCESPPNIRCDLTSRYRNANGSCSNILHPTWGMAFTPQKRFIEAEYNDGEDSPRNLTVDKTMLLPSARVISNKLHDLKEAQPEVDVATSVMFMQFGQFLDHDIVQTPIMTGANGSAIDCCDADEIREECFDIEIPYNDPHFTGNCMDLVRSAPAVPEDCRQDDLMRQQLNQITSVIDMSAIYGSSDEETASLREFKDGRLKVSPHDLLPPRSSAKGCTLTDNTTWCQKAGDKRANVIPGLGALHTISVRLHNVLVQELSDCNLGHWDDERLFQEARKITGAILQHITYNEYLPLVVGNGIMLEYGLYSSPMGFDNVYNVSVDPSIRNGFAAAAFRFQHAAIVPNQAFRTKGSTETVSFPIEDTYFNPRMVQADEGKGVDNMCRWLVEDNSLIVGRHFVKGTRDLLFLDSKNMSLDLPALNTQRGRDHGLPSYNKWRVRFALSDVKSCSVEEFVHHEPAVAEILCQIYNSVDDIDLYTAGITEKHVPGGSVGPTFARIIAQQFQYLKQGDRFWYENGDDYNSQAQQFTKDQLNEIKKMTLSRVLCDTTDIDEVQKFAMKAESIENPKASCSDEIPKMDIRQYWREEDE